MKVFVTGSTGLLGNNLVRALLAEGHEVVGLTRTRAKATRLLGDTDAHFVEGDMADIEGFTSAMDGVDAVVHTAAYFREYDGGSEHSAALEAINIDGTLRLMAEADRRGVTTFVHVGSSGAVGHDEDSPPTDLQLQNHYFLSKRDGDDRIAAFDPKSDMKIVEILPGWMWGPGDAGPTAAGRLCLDFMAGKLPVVPDGGSAAVDARDVAVATIRAIERGQHRDRFIVAGSYLSLMDCTRALADASGQAAPRFEAPAWLALAVAHVGEFAARLRGQKPSVPVFGLKLMLLKHSPSSARAVERLDADFRPFSETARDVVAWYRLHGKDFGFETP